MRRPASLDCWKLAAKTIVAIALLAILPFATPLPAKGATVFSFGYNGYGQTGLGSITPVDTPIATPIDTSRLNGATITQVSVGFYHCLLLAGDGTVFEMGWNEFATTGEGSGLGYTTVATPIDTTNLAGKRITQVAAGNQHNLLLAADGSVYSYGNNIFGRTGLGIGGNTTTPVATPINLSNLQGKTVTQVAAGDLHSLLLADDGSVYSFGVNASGRTGLGIDMATATLIPTQIDASKFGSRKIKQVAAGGTHSLLLAEDGTVFSFGRLSPAGLGLSPALRTPVVATPIRTENLDGRKITKIAAGDSHSLLLADDGTVFSFGSNGAGKTGLGLDDVDYTHVATPIDVTNLQGKRILDVAAGHSHSLILAEDGAVYSFGTGAYGISGLGLGHRNSSIATPIDTSNLANWRVTGLAAGAYSSLLLAVPEPGTATLALIASLSLPIRRRR